MYYFKFHQHSSPWRLQARYLVYAALLRLFSLVQAAPTLTSRASTTSTSGLLPSPTTSSSGDRDGSLEILADGTQDLAALVGLFAIDSVEQYTCDYPRGYLSSLVSTLSLLGLLGWSRAMLKLALGRERCENAAFDTKTVRPIYGIAGSHHISADDVFDVFFMVRHEGNGIVRWEVTQVVRHTTESMPFLKATQLYAHLRDENSVPVVEYKLTNTGKWISKSKHLGLIAMMLLICNGATSFSILIFRGGQ